MVKLRKAYPQDVNQIPALYEGDNYYFPFNPFKSADNLKFALKHNLINLDNFTVAVYHRKIIGWVFYQFFDYDLFSSEACKSALIRELHISEKCRYIDVGKLLIKTVIEKMKLKKINVLYVILSPKLLTKYKKLLKSLHFKRYDPKDVYRYVFSAEKKKN